MLALLASQTIPSFGRLRFGFEYPNFVERDCHIPWQVCPDSSEVGVSTRAAGAPPERQGPEHRGRYTGRTGCLDQAATATPKNEPSPTLLRPVGTDAQACSRDGAADRADDAEDPRTRGEV